MFLSSAAISQAKNFLKSKSAVVEQYSLKGQAVSDPTRVKILMLLGKYKELCPSDIAKILQVTPAAVSHQMRVLESVSLVKKIRMGKMICYSLKNIKGRNILPYNLWPMTIH